MLPLPSTPPAPPPPFPALAPRRSPLAPPPSPPFRADNVPTDWLSHSTLHSSAAPPGTPPPPPPASSPLVPRTAHARIYLAHIQPQSGSTHTPPAAALLPAGPPKFPPQYPEQTPKH